jgi:Do/DeqQ family serine protease
MKKVLFVVTISMLSAFIGAFFAIKYATNLNKEATPSAVSYGSDAYYSTSSAIADAESLPTGTENFVLASSKTTNSVVFIQTTSEYEYRTGNWLDWFFEAQPSQQTSSGSGVILSKDGYIVTNNHVIENAKEIRVISGKKTYEGKLIGRDPSTDLAVIKIDEATLPAIELGNSDNVKVGEWVLAVGNPFNLTSTVTAGIVSAKGRNLNLLRDKFPIESFIQTDAAINPGNSGGALVNSSGQLIGINTAILSRTGSYAGYGFAVPVNIVKKVFNDITQYGEVQKAFLGAEYVDIDTEMSKKLKIDDLSGVLVAEVSSEGAAKTAGLERGDIILEVNGQVVDNKGSIEELIGNKYPGDKLELIVKREGKRINKSLVLTNREGGTGIIKRRIYSSDRLQVSLEAVSKVEKNMYDIKSGVKVVDFTRNGFFDQLDIPQGFIITQINNVPVEKPEELAEILEKVKGRVRIYGVDERGRKVYYPFYF